MSSRLRVLGLALAFAAFVVAAPAVSAGCPPHSHADHVERDGNVRTVHCKCDAGYESRGGRCAKVASPIIDPRAMVTGDLYQAALADCRHLSKVQHLLQRKIGQLQGWRSDTRRYQSEYEAERADAVRGVFSDAMDAVPIEALAPRIAKGALAQERLKAAFDAVHATVSLAEGISEPENAEQFKKIAEGELDTRKALLTIPLSQGSAQTRHWMENLGEVYGSGVKLAAFARQARDGKPHGISEWGELAGELWGVWYPPVRVSVALTKLAIRGEQAHTAQASVAELSDVLAQNWNAELHLHNKIQQLTAFIAEETRTIDSYRALHSQAAACEAE